MATISEGAGPQAHTSSPGRGGPGPGYGGRVTRGTGHKLLVGKGTLDKIKQLMEKLVNATQQTAFAIQSQNPIPNPYVTEYQEKQAQYVKLLNKPNKTALDQFLIKRLGQRIQELTQRIQTEQSAPKKMTLQDTSVIKAAIKDTVSEAIKQSERPPMTSKPTQVERSTRTQFTSTEPPKTSHQYTSTALSPPVTPPITPPGGGRLLRRRPRQQQRDSRAKGVKKVKRLIRMPWLD